MSAIGNFQMYVMNRMVQQESAPVEEENTPPVSETQVDTGVLHDDEAWFAYRHGCG